MNREEMESRLYRRKDEARLVKMVEEGGGEVVSVARADIPAKLPCHPLARQLRVITPSRRVAD